METRNFLALGLLCLLAAQPGLSFGTIDGSGYHAEHEHITRNALACKPGVRSTGDCFETQSILSLAGGPGTAGAVGSPDADEILDAHAHCDDADYIDHAKYGLPGTYPRTRAEATTELVECVAHLSRRFHEGITAAQDLLNDKDTIIKDESDLDNGTCTFVGRVGNRAKCDVLEGFGRALHGIQDFYSHSNWADVADPTTSISRDNPPGLDLPATAPILDLRSATSAGGLSIPNDLSTGCFISSLTDPFGGAAKCVEQGRITHVTLNKDKGVIRLDPFVSLPASSPLTSAPDTTRGRIGTNMEKAVVGAILETRRQWADFRAELVSRYGPRRAALMVCALTRDRPWRDCAGRRLAVVIDSSGSNQDTDPSNLRVSAGIQFVSTLVTAANAGPDNAPDLVTVVDFDSSASVVYPLGDPAGASFAGIDSSGGTFIAGGVVLAIEELTRNIDPEAIKDRTGIVVLTDGQDSSIFALVAAIDRCRLLGIRVSFGFLAPPANPVPKPRRALPRRSVNGENQPPHGLYRRQASGSNPLGGTSPEVVAAVLRTGGVFSTITSAEAQQRFVDLVVSRGSTNIDGIGSQNGGPLFPGVTVVALASAGNINPDTYTYRASAGEKLKFTAQTISTRGGGGNATLDVTLRDVRGGRELGKAVADATSGGAAVISHDAAGAADLELLVRASGALGGNSTMLYAVTLEVAAPPVSLCSVPHNATCANIGETKCCGTGFLTCDHARFVYRPCGPGTTCKEDNGSGGVYCGWP